MQHIVINDENSVWFTNDLNENDSGCSVSTNTKEEMLNEVKDFIDTLPLPTTLVVLRPKTWHNIVEDFHTAKEEGFMFFDCDETQVFTCTKDEAILLINEEYGFEEEDINSVLKLELGESVNLTPQWKITKIFV